ASSLLFKVNPLNVMPVGDTLTANESPGFRPRAECVPGPANLRRMKAYTEHVTFNTKERYEIFDITEHVERVRAKADLSDGFVLVSAMHITASVFVND